MRKRRRVADKAASFKFALLKARIEINSNQKAQKLYGFRFQTTGRKKASKLQNEDRGSRANDSSASFFSSLRLESIFQVSKEGSEPEKSEHGTNIYD